MKIKREIEEILRRLINDYDQVDENVIWDKSACDAVDNFIHRAAHNILKKIKDNRKDNQNDNQKTEPH